MIKVLNQILSIKLDEGVKIDVVDIREKDKYSGNKYH